MNFRFINIVDSESPYCGKNQLANNFLSECLINLKETIEEVKWSILVSHKWSVICIVAFIMKKMGVGS